MNRRLLKKEAKTGRHIKCHESGIYFLINNGRVVYIGSTKDFPRRVSSHYDKMFDSIRFIPCEDFKDQEIRWMRIFKPKYNTQTFVPEWRSILIGTGHFSPSNSSFINY